MTVRPLLVGISLLASAILPSAAFAQAGVEGPVMGECIENLYDAFGREHRLSRAVTFGQPAAENAPLTAVYYDRDGDPWVKTAENQWSSPSDEFDGETWSDGDMDDQVETDPLCENNEDDVEESCVKLPRRGIFEIRKTPTSDLVHPIVQTVRALQCRLRAVCELAAESQGKESGDTVTIELDGCLPMTFPVMEGCRNIDSTVYNTFPTSCREARRTLVQREMELLTLTVSYDASYRSLAQFAGMFQEFLTQFRFPLIEPLWQTVRMLGGLDGIPCFQAECNE
jgi:uncharacterized protein YijF (DUF1287 family)